MKNSEISSILLHFPAKMSVCPIFLPKMSILAGKSWSVIGSKQSHDINKWFWAGKSWSVIGSKQSHDNNKFEGGITFSLRVVSFLPSLELNGKITLRRRRHRIMIVTCQLCVHLIVSFQVYISGFTSVENSCCAWAECDRVPTRTGKPRKK